MTNILIADDDPYFRNRLNELLSAQGTSVTMAEDGAAALALAKAMSFDYLLTDGSMPKMDGFDLIKSLSASDIKLRRVVMITGLPEFDTRITDIENYVDHKNIDLRILFKGECSDDDILRALEA